MEKSIQEGRGGAVAGGAGSGGRRRARGEWRRREGKGGAIDV